MIGATYTLVRSGKSNALSAVLFSETGAYEDMLSYYEGQRRALGHVG